MEATKKMSYRIDVVLMLLTVVSLTFIPAKLQVLLKYTLLAYLFCKYVWYLNGNKGLFSLLGVYTLVLSLSTIMNTGSITWMLAAFMTGVQLIALFLVSAAVCQQMGREEYIDWLIRLFSVLLLLNDLLFFVMPYDFSNADESYLVGNKFLVTYYHCFLSCLVYVKTTGKKTNYLVALLFILCAVVAWRVSCSTGIIMAAVLLVMMLVPKKMRKALQNPQMLFAAIGLENLLIWSAADIFKNPVVNAIAVKVFHKSPNMSGRFKLYDITPSLVKQKPLIGYGHNTDIYRELFGYGNAQNGLFHIIVQAGILGALVYFGAVYLGLRNKGKEKTPYGLYMYLFAMVVASAIEINLSLQFMLGVAVIYGLYAQNWKKQIV